MKERGMIFNAEMVRAIIDGRKTMTRRIMKVQPENSELGLSRIIDSSVAKEVGMYFWSQADACGVKRRSKPFPCPFGAVGDRIWVRETFSGHYLDDAQIHDIKDGRDKATDLCEYRADYPDGYQASDGWTPSIHMPRWASRITLEITGVRVERLQNISDEDVDAEGFSGDYPTSIFPNLFPGESNDWSHLSMRDCYGVLWKSIYGEESWQDNPWVWVISFKRVEGGAA